MFGEGVEQREGDVAVMKSPINRIERHVFEEIVHPTHVPFESEPQPAEIDRPRNARPGSGFFRDRDDSRKTLVTNFVEPFQKINRVQIFAAAKNIRDPLTWLARVIEI